MACAWSQSVIRILEISVLTWTGCLVAFHRTCRCAVSLSSPWRTPWTCNKAWPLAPPQSLRRRWGESRIPCSEGPLPPKRIGLWFLYQPLFLHSLLKKTKYNYLFQLFQLFISPTLYKHSNQSKLHSTLLITLFLHFKNERSF